MMIRHCSKVDVSKWGFSHLTAGRSWLMAVYTCIGRDEVVVVPHQHVLLLCVAVWCLMYIDVCSIQDTQL